MPVRHPLQELPLDQFVSADRQGSLKRPLSPGTLLLSPSKRRILTSEGLYSPEKKAKKLQTPPRHPPPSTGLFLPPHQLTPKKLDFTLSSNPAPEPTTARRLPLDAFSIPSTPVAQIGAPKLAPSPEIAPASSSFSASNNNSDHLELAAAADTPRATTTQCPAPMLIPRELPTFSDKQSVHWPGFDVYVDTHIYIPTSSSLSCAPPSSRAEIVEAGETKENFQPKRIIGKRSKTTKAFKGGQTDDPFQPGDIMTMLSPASSKNHHVTPKEKELEKKKMKLIMIRETDDMDDENDVEEQL